MGHPGFGFIAVIAVAAYIYATGLSLVASAAFFGMRRFGSFSSRKAGKWLAGGVGALGAAIVGYGWFAFGGEAAVFIAITVGATTLGTGVIPLGIGYAALSRLTDADDPLTNAVIGWFPSLVAPGAVIYLFGGPATTLGLIGLLAIPTFGPTAIGYAIHRVRSR